MDSDNGVGRGHTFNTLDNLERLAFAVDAMRTEGWHASDDEVYQIICGESQETAEHFELWENYEILDRTLTAIFNAGCVPKK